ncbi:MAG: TPM domain-containing protein [Tissierellia bacterium]|nr:TPM domain-containing protein [Tissierellia bacterium]
MVKTRRILGILMIVVLFLLRPNTAYADLGQVRDESGHLNNESVLVLENLIGETESQYEVPIFIYITGEDLRGSARNRADDLLFDFVGKDQDGLLLYVNMNTRDYHFTLSGRVLSMLDDRRQEILDKIIVKDLRNDNIAQAAINFVTKASDYIARGEIAGNVQRPEKNLSVIDIIIASGAGLTSFFASRLIFRNSLKPKPSAFAYNLGANSAFVVHHLSDRLLNKDVRTRKIAQHVSASGGSGRSITTSHRGSRGGTFSGRGGKF